MCKWIFLLMLISITSMSAPIEFPEEELATETVLPKYDYHITIRNRNIVTAERPAVGVFGGLSLFEPFFSQTLIGLYGDYHFTESSAVHVTGMYWIPGFTSSAENLKNKHNLHFENAPAPENMILGEYQYSAWYGKLNLSKQMVMNSHLYGLVGGGMITIGGKANPTLAAGLGQKFSVTKDFSLRFDLRFLMYESPDPLSQNLTNLTEKVDVSNYEKQSVLSSQLTVGLLFLM